MPGSAGPGGVRWKVMLPWLWWGGTCDIDRAFLYAGNLCMEVTRIMEPVILSVCKSCAASLLLKLFWHNCGSVSVAESESMAANGTSGTTNPNSTSTVPEKDQDP